MKIFDISPQVSEKIAVYPGDVAYSRQVAMDMKKGDHLTLSSISTTLHVGAHADAPSHYHAEGESIGRRDLSYYMGRAQVVSIKGAHGRRLGIKDLAKTQIQAPRVLFKTGSFPNPEFWNSDFTSLSPELIEWLSNQGVQLVGIDTPSVDPETSKDLESHQAIYSSNMAILEGLVLTEVPEGLYQLIALPLALSEADASPVRAVLLPLETRLAEA